MPIGYFVGGANIISGLGNIVLGMVVPGVFWIVLGAVIIHDIRSIR
jgi:hypothetical protein